MYIRKNFTLKGILIFSGGHITWLTAWGAFVTALYGIFHHSLEFLQIPIAPLSIIGTAVAFYVGFKNNSSYDRLWEARKIWGGIVNSSRMWGANVKAYVTNQFTENKISESEMYDIHKTLIYRHLGYLYTLRSQLLIPTPWESASQEGHLGKTAKKRLETFGIGLYDDNITEKHLDLFLEEKEKNRVIDFQNTATQLIDLQSQELKKLREKGLTDDFRHIELQNLLNEFYTLQGKAERIKKFPLPRQYANMSWIFIGIFIFILPFSLASVFHAVEEIGKWWMLLNIIFTTLVGWVYVMMELVGDSSENPFEGNGNDIPMYSLCRVIEIDLREMLGETDLPPKVAAVNGVLM